MAKQKSSQSLAPSPEMDPRVWSHLPEDLLERVLSFLPLKTFLTLRSTSKHFKSLISSPFFISQHSSSPSSSSSPVSSFLLLCNPHFHRRFPLYDTAVSAWRGSPLSLPPSPLLSCAPSSLLSISHGLLCFSLPNSSSFLICNLLARSSRIVKFPTHPFQFELLTLVSTGDKFRLFMLSSSSSGSSSNNAFVYDSGLDLWQQFGRVDSSLCDNYLQEGVFFNGCLYFTTPEPFSIVGFNLESGEWGTPTTVELPPLAAELTFLRLASDGGKKLYSIGGVGENGISRSVKVWELDGGDGGDGAGRWAEIGIVPGMMCRKLKSVCYHNYEHVYCFWHQGLICICCYNWPEILYYKVSKRTWHWLPKCPSLPEKWSCGFRWFSLVPGLHASL